MCASYNATDMIRVTYTSFFFFFFFFGSPDCSIQQAVYKHVSLLYSFSSISSTWSTYSVQQTCPEIIHCWPVVFRIGIYLCAFDIVIGLFCVLLWSVYHILIVLLVNHIYTSSTICSSVLVKAQLSHPHKLPRIIFQYPQFGICRFVFQVPGIWLKFTDEAFAMHIIYFYFCSPFLIRYYDVAQLFEIVD